MKTLFVYQFISLFFMTTICCSKTLRPASTKYEKRSLKSLMAAVENFSFNDNNFEALMKDLTAIDSQEDHFYRLITDKRLDILETMAKEAQVSGIQNYELPERIFQFAFFNVTSQNETFGPVNERILQYLLILGADLNSYNEDFGGCALSEAILTGNLAAIRWVINNPSFDPKSLNNYALQACFMALIKCPYLSLNAKNGDENFINRARQILVLLKSHGIGLFCTRRLFEGEKKKVQPLVNLLQSIFLDEN